MEPNNEILIERGNAAENLLKQGVFVAAMNDLINIYLGGLIQTKAEETQQREHLYAGARAVQDIFGVLNQWVAVRDQTLENIANQEEPDSI